MWTLMDLSVLWSDSEVILSKTCMGLCEPLWRFWILLIHLWLFLLVSIIKNHTYFHLIQTYTPSPSAMMRFEGTWRSLAFLWHRFLPWSSQSWSRLTCWMIKRTRNHTFLTVWRYSEVQQRCGACGKSGHVFKDCPSKNAPIPTLHLTFKKPSSKPADHGDDEMDPSNVHGWNTVGKDNKILKAEQNYLSTNNNVYSSENGGIKIIYESEDSDESNQCIFEENEHFDITPNLIVVAADLHPYNLGMENKKLAESENHHVAGNIKSSMEVLKEEETEKSLYNTANELAGKVGLQQLETKGGSKESELGIKSKGIQEADNRTNVNKITGNKCGLFDGSSSKNRQDIIEPAHVFEVEEDFSDEEQFEYEYDELIVDDTVEKSFQLPPAPVYQLEGMSQIMISDDPPFSESNLVAFINEEPIKLDSLPTSPEESYQTMQNSMNSSSSFAVEMRNLDVHKVETSNSNSGKRKNLDGECDTASSKIKVGKRFKK